MAGNRAVGQLLTVQRTRVPMLGEPPDNARDREAEERTTLLVLSGQVANLRERLTMSHDLDALYARQREITRLIGTADRDRREINKLIADVDRAHPGSAPQQPQHLAQLTGSEWSTLRSKLREADALIAGTKDQTIDLLFGNAVRGQVRANLAEIRAHLRFWAAKRKKRIAVDRTGTDTLNRDVGAASILVLGSDFTRKNDLARTLVHEASHGCEAVQTVDFSYFTTSYFLSLPPVAALKNADHYAIATDEQAARRLAAAPGVSADLAAATRVVDRVCFVCRENWKHAKWLIDAQTKHHETNQAKFADLGTHAGKLGFSAAAGSDPEVFKQLRVEHLVVLRDFFLRAGDYLSSGYQLRPSRERDSLFIRKDPALRLEISDYSRLDEDQAFRAVLLAVAESRGLAPQLDVLGWSEALFERFFLGTATAEGLAVWDMLSQTERRDTGKSK